MSYPKFRIIFRTPKNQYLVQQGDEAKYEYLIMSGIFTVFYLDQDGKEHIVQFATENWRMSDYIAYFNQKHANMYVLCMEPGEVLCLTFEGREQLSLGPHKM
ncbi:Crp/Fnr family transcriptional regulator [Flavobacterium alkalisoli]|uniref:Crp/Fnr family transcriptional regulator n=1 Tax=Flavobacterium alkalisoli TaxID=2602769 RepID=A0A5B9FVF9_9FLAO|nr:Crp/Fnr family transcriptional regulator [Flavobacterium alkalisoli]